MGARKLVRAKCGTEIKGQLPAHVVRISSRRVAVVLIINVVVTASGGNVQACRYVCNIQPPRFVTEKGERWKKREGGP